MTAEPYSYGWVVRIDDVEGSPEEVTATILLSALITVLDPATGEKHLKGPGDTVLVRLPRRVAANLKVDSWPRPR